MRDLRVLAAVPGPKSVSGTVSGRYPPPWIHAGWPSVDVWLYHEQRPLLLHCEWLPMPHDELMRAEPDWRRLPAPVCRACVHYQGGLSCTAFPRNSDPTDGIPPIPQAIWLGGALHQEPWPGDHGTRFEQAADRPVPPQLLTAG